MFPKGHLCLSPCQSLSEKRLGGPPGSSKNGVKQTLTHIPSPQKRGRNGTRRTRKTRPRKVPPLPRFSSLFFFLGGGGAECQLMINKCTWKKDKHPPRQPKSNEYTIKQMPSKNPQGSASPKVCFLTSLLFSSARVCVHECVRALAAQSAHQKPMRRRPHPRHGLGSAWECLRDGLGVPGQGF